MRVVDQIVHVAAENLVHLIAEHVESGAVDESAATFAINAVDTLTNGI